MFPPVPGANRPHGPRLLLTEHTQTAAHDEQNARQDDENTATAATRPGAVRPPRVVILAPAKQRSAAANAHRNFSPLEKESALPPSPGRRDTLMVVGVLAGLHLRDPPAQLVDPMGV